VTPAGFARALLFTFASIDTGSRRRGGEASL
jgi:hypothetical protein